MIRVLDSYITSLQQAAAVLKLFMSWTPCMIITVIAVVVMSNGKIRAIWNV